MLLRSDAPGGLWSPHSLNRLFVVLVIRAHFDGNEAALPRCLVRALPVFVCRFPFFSGPGHYPKRARAPDGRGGRHQRRKSVRIRHIPIRNGGDGGLFAPLPTATVKKRSSRNILLYEPTPMSALDEGPRIFWSAVLLSFFVVYTASAEPCTDRDDIDNDSVQRYFLHPYIKVLG